MAQTLHPGKLCNTKCLPESWGNQLTSWRRVIPLFVCVIIAPLMKTKLEPQKGIQLYRAQSAMNIKLLCELGLTNRTALPLQCTRLSCTGHSWGKSRQRLLINMAQTRFITKLNFTSAKTHQLTPHTVRNSFILAHWYLSNRHTFFPGSLNCTRKSLLKQYRIQAAEAWLAIPGAGWGVKVSGMMQPWCSEIAG